VTQADWRKCLGVLGLGFAAVISTRVSSAQSIVLEPADALRARYAELRDQLDSSPIQQGVHVESADSARTPSGHAYAIVEYPFARAQSAFSTPAVLCESLLLHLNVHYCRAAGGDGSPVLSVALGRKKPQALEDTHRIDLAFRAEKNADYLRIELAAKEGPLGTSDYLIAMELVALDEERAFMHIHYAYKQGLLARIATSVYFSTGGRDKIGFTLLEGEDGEAPQPVRGIRGVLERNTMRYYLAFDAYLHALADSSPQRFERSAERWFAETERFARQLHEVERDDYVAMKRNQYRRQQTAM
jgi:hypothetical protein